MRSPCNPEVLEALALHEAALPEQEAAAARAHAATCPDCQRELLWLRAERDLLRRRQQALAPVDLNRLFTGMETRLPAPCLARRAPLSRYRSALWAAAAVLAAIVMQQGTGLLSGFTTSGDGKKKGRRLETSAGQAAGQATLSLSGPVQLLLQTGAADVEVDTGQPGQLVVKADEAPVHLVQQADRVEARFGGGKLRSGSVRAVLPPGSKVHLDTVEGDMTVRGALSQIQARSTSGGLTVEGDDPNLDFTSVSGDLSYRGGCGAGCSMDLRTVSGEVELRLSRSSSFELRYTTRSGDFSDEFSGQPGQSGPDEAPPPAIFTRYGKGEGRIRATTVSGDLTLGSH